MSLTTGFETTLEVLRFVRAVHQLLGFHHLDVMHADFGIQLVEEPLTLAAEWWDERTKGWSSRLRCSDHTLKMRIEPTMFPEGGIKTWLCYTKPVYPRP